MGIEVKVKVIRHRKGSADEWGECGGYGVGGGTGKGGTQIFAGHRSRWGKFSKVGDLLPCKSGSLLYLSFGRTVSVSSFTVQYVNFVHLLLGLLWHFSHTIIPCAMAGVTREGVGDRQAVRIISLNTTGLNALVKCTKIMTNVINVNTDIMLLQETHLITIWSSKFNRPWIG